MRGTNLRLRRHACAHRTATATMAEACGDSGVALAAFQDAAVAWRAYGHVLEHAYALLGAGRCARRLSLAGAASDLREARDIFASLGAQSLVLEAEAWGADLVDLPDGSC
jgi:hypothetical protein